MQLNFLEWIGYAASLTIVLSMMLSSLIKFRWVNLVGALLFSVYGFLIHAIPVGVLNGIIVLVDVYYLAIIYSKKETFEILEINAESIYLGRFLKFHDAKIQTYCPGFAYTPDSNTVIFFILRNMAVTGLFIAQREHGTVLKVLLDYVLPEYKDFKNGKYVYFKLKDRFLAAGFTSIVAEGNNKNYFRYLKKFGFSEVSTGVYRKDL